jgi:nucleoside-diphosphate kinase
MSSNTRYCFVTEFFDTMAGIVRQYQLYYYPEDGSIEMHDVKLKKVFLKKMVYPEVSLKDLYLGSDLTIFSRKLKVVDYGDSFTRKKFQESRSSTYGMIKPDAYMNIGKIIDMIYNVGGFTISKLKMVKFKPEDAGEFYAEHKGKTFYDGLINFMCSDLIVGMELVQKDAIKTWREFIGPTNSLTARETAPNSIRGVFGTDGTKNAVHGSDSDISASRELQFIFGGKIKSQPTLNNCTCLIIKPHAIAEGNAGKIIDILLSEGFEISSLEMFYLDKTTAEEFFEVYKGVLPEYAAMIDHVTTGPIIVLEVRQENVVSSMRALCGPHDPEIAKTLRPNTIRAIFGKDRVKNAVHCTDLTEDGVLEVQYFFELLQEK